MKKLIVLMGTLALVLGTAGLGQVLAGPYGTNITIYDNAPIPGPGPGVGVGNEDQETEPSTYTGQGWDLEAFKQKGSTLSIIGGFDFATGQVHESGQPAFTEPLGALFFKTGALAPAYGAVANAGTDDAHTSLANSLLWNYDYAMTFNFTNNTYTLYSDLNHTANVIMHSSDGGQFTTDCANPWNIGTGWTSVLTNNFTYLTNQTDAQVDGDLLGGTHNVITGIDLNFLVTDPSLGNPLTWLHFTYDCGNDNLMGQIPAGSVPLPPAALLLGTGLLGLVGLHWRKKGRAS